MCAHTASIVYFLGYMSHKAFKEPLPKVKKFKSHMFSKKYVEIVINNALVRLQLDFNVTLTLADDLDTDKR